MKRKNIAISIILIVIPLIIFTGCGSDKVKSKLIIVHAGSLSIPFKNLSREFMKKNPEIDIIREAYGSRTAARQVSDLGRSVDIVASADSDVIRKLLYPDFADFCIDFTKNEMVIAGTKHSRFAKIISSSNWYDILLKNGIEFGYSEPDSDPCGYRSILTMKLAEKFYKSPDLFQKFIKSTKQKNIRPKEVDLLALLEAGELDYIFIYRSVAEQHGLNIISLPDEINLGSSIFAEKYRRVYVDIIGKRPGETIRKYGMPMIYGLTIPFNSLNKENAVKFINYILSKEGKAIMKRSGQPVLIQPIVDTNKNLPDGLKYIKQKNEQ